jgi:hypothetical protein
MKTIHTPMKKGRRLDRLLILKNRVLTISKALMELLHELESRDHDTQPSVICFTFFL